MNEQPINLILLSENYIPVEMNLTLVYFSSIYPYVNVRALKELFIPVTQDSIIFASYSLESKKIVVT